MKIKRSEFRKVANEVIYNYTKKIMEVAKEAGMDDSSVGAGEMMSCIVVISLLEEKLFGKGDADG